jgi:hypothetical protein
MRGGGGWVFVDQPVLSDAANEKGLALPHTPARQRHQAARC